MTTWGVQTMQSFELVGGAREKPCFICQHGNRPGDEFCRHCHAPLALTVQAEQQKSPPCLVAAAGAPGVGKTVYLGMLTDILSRQHGALQILARGALSVTLQQQTMSALARCKFPPPTPADPEHWNWVHCEVLNTARKTSRPYLLPDFPGEVFLEEVEHRQQVPVLHAFLSKCAAAMIFVGVDALERGQQEQDFLAMKSVSYLIEQNSHRRKGWPARPLALVFTKADQSEACFDDPQEYARINTPGLYRQCREQLGRYRFFATSVIGACAPLQVLDRILSIPLRIEPRGVEAPFAWIVEQLS
jgi:hypothetical protein